MGVSNGGPPVRRKIVKDVVHQFVELPGDFFDTCIDSVIVQRLRDIRQLSMAHLVYPGATHTRFEHSLGVAYTMRRALRSIRDNLDEIVAPLVARSLDPPHDSVVSQFLRHLSRKLGDLEGEAVTAAVLHDSGHVFLSHAAEEAMRDKIIDYTPLPGGERLVTPRFDHEELTLMIADTLAKLQASKKTALGMLDCKQVREPCVDVCYAGRPVDMKTVYEILELAYGRGDGLEYCRPLSYNVVLEGLEYKVEVKNGSLEEAARKAAMCVASKLLSHSVDVDRADYILRDSIHSGSMAGIYDINRFYSVLTIVPRLVGTMNAASSAVTVYIDIGVLDKGISVVENMLLSRVYMYSDVYLHDISMIYSAMASRLLALLYILAGGIVEGSGDHGVISIIRELLDFVRGKERARVEEEYSPRKAFQLLESLLPLASDHEFESFVRRVAAGGMTGLLQSIAGGAGESWSERMCIAIALLAKGLAERKHWSALILDEDDKAAKIIRSLSSEDYAFLQELKTHLTPLVIVSSSKLSAYDPDDPKLRIMVFRRDNPLVPAEISTLPHARVVRKIAGEHYSKVLILFPEDGRSRKMPVPEAWRLRRGKVTVREIEWAAGQCGVDAERARRMILEDAEKAVALADRFWSLI